MLKVIHVKPPGYEHAACFDHVAAALRNAALDCPRAEGRVVIGAHLVAEIPTDCTIWNFEQIDNASDWISPSYVEACRNADRLWDYSPANVAAWRNTYGIEAELLPLAYDPAMVSSIGRCKAKRSAPSFYGSWNERRSRILSVIDCRLLPLPIYGADLDRELSMSPCVINVHYYDAAIFEIVRCSYLFANAVPVMSEESADQAEYHFIPDLFHTSDKLRDRAKARDYPSGDDQRRAYMGEPHLREHLGGLL